MAPPLPPNRPSLNLLNIKDGETVYQVRLHNSKKCFIVPSFFRTLLPLSVSY